MFAGFCHQFESRGGPCRTHLKIGEIILPHHCERHSRRQRSDPPIRGSLTRDGRGQIINCQDCPNCLWRYFGSETEGRGYSRNNHNRRRSSGNYKHHQTEYDHDNRRGRQNNFNPAYYEE